MALGRGWVVCGRVERDRYDSGGRGGVDSRAIFDYIEGWYNPHRRHSALAYHSPANYEKITEEAADAA